MNWILYEPFFSNLDIFLRFLAVFFYCCTTFDILAITKKIHQRQLHVPSDRYPLESMPWSLLVSPLGMAIGRDMHE